MNIRRDKDLININQNNVEAVIPEKVKSYGNGAKIKFSKRFLNKNVLVVVLKNE